MRGLLGSGGRGRGRAEPQSFGSKWTSSEGGETAWTTRQLCLVGFHEAGHEVNCVVGFYKASAETIPEVPLRGSIPSMPEFTRNLSTKASFVIKAKTKTRQERRWCWGVITTVPAAPVRPAPYSFSSFISTMSVLSSAAGMSVMAESSPSTADSFSIFFFCFR